MTTENLKRIISMYEEGMVNREEFIKMMKEELDAN